MAVSLILDTDLGGDIDDALALAFCVRHPDIDLRAVTTVADDTARRGRWTRHLLHAAGRDDIEVSAGVGWSEPPAGRESAWPHDGHGLPEDHIEISERDAVTVLLDTPNVVIATVGMQSNVAAAVERDATFPRRVPLLAVMGGVFAPVIVGPEQELPPSVDHNLCVDPEASVASLNAGFNAIYTPIDVTVQARLQPEHLAALHKGDDFCQLIARCIETWHPTSHKPPGIVAVMHDPLTVAVLVERSFVTTTRAPVTVVRHPAGHIRTLIDPLEGTESEIVTSVDGKAFCDYWLETMLG